MAFGLTPWDPFRDLDRLERTMRRGFDWPAGRAATESLGAPAIEVTDEGDHYLVKAEIPGVSEKEVDIALTGNVLTIRGEKRYEKRAPQWEAGAEGAGEQQQAAPEKQEKTGKQDKQQAVARREQGGAMARPLFSEVYYGRFERMLTLPDDIDADKVEASYQNGVFAIEIGRKEKQRSRKIEITRH
jgi:HSP20 family protein